MGELATISTTHKGALLAAALILGACVAPTSNLPQANPEDIRQESRKQQAIVIREQDQQFARLMRVGMPILAANTDQCGDQIAHRAGVHFHSARLDVSNETRLATVEARGLSRPGEVRVSFTIPGFPAENVLQPGDIVTEINGVNAYSAKFGLKRVDWRRPDLDVSLLRQGQALDVTIPTIPVCDIAVRLSPAQNLNASARPGLITMNMGSMRQLTSDQDLALLFGHELAHLTQNHIEAKLTNARVGAVVGALVSGIIGVDVTRVGARIGANSFSQEFELEADYVGMYHASRAGWDMSGAASMFRRMATARPASIHAIGGTHPNTVRRAVMVEQTAIEIEEKRSNNLALVHNYKGQPPSNFPNTGPTLAAQAREAGGSPTTTSNELAAVPAHNRDNVEQQFRRAVELEQGVGGIANYAEAAKLYRQAAAGGHRSAMYNLGMMYVEGRGVQQNNGEAVIYFRQAAELKHAKAHYNLGFMQENGRGTARNPTRGLTSYIIASNLGVGSAAGSAQRRLTAQLSPAQVREAERLANDWMRSHQR